MGGRTDDAGGDVWGRNGTRHGGSSAGHGGLFEQTLVEMAACTLRNCWCCFGWCGWCRDVAVYRRLAVRRAKNWFIAAVCGVLRSSVSGGVSMGGGNVSSGTGPAAGIEARHEQRKRDLARQVIAMALLACGVTMLGVTYAGESARQQARDQGRRPNPAPQMTAPAPSHGDRVQFGLIEAHHTGRGW